MKHIYKSSNPERTLTILLVILIILAGVMGFFIGILYSYYVGI